MRSIRNIKKEINALRQVVQKEEIGLNELKEYNKILSDIIGEINELRGEIREIVEIQNGDSIKDYKKEDD
ncbi:MAG TPA: hypothetical protein VK426_09410 [Methanobacterium sp.]|nr:hypothetical protein [Methanobacterium sp.]